MINAALAALARRRLENQIFAMREEELSELFAVLHLENLASGLLARSDDSGDKVETTFDASTKTLTVPISGVLMRSVPRIFSRLGIGATALPAIRDAVASAAANPDVETIKLEIDSPGGEYAGTEDVADAIFAARSAKHVKASVKNLAASAAYWLAAQAHEIEAHPGATLGSIGVYRVHTDFSGMDAQDGIKRTLIRSGPLKGAGAVGPLSEDELRVAQEMIDQAADRFADGVWRGRGDRLGDRQEITTGRAWMGEHAAALGLVDTLKSFTTAAPPPDKKEYNMEEQIAGLTSELEAARSEIEGLKASQADLEAKAAEAAAVATERDDAVASLEQVRAENKTLKTELAQAIVDHAIELGRVAPAAKADMVEIAGEDPDRMRRLVKISPTATRPDADSRASEQAAAPGSVGEFTEEEIKSAAYWGKDPAELRKLREGAMS